MPALFGIYIKQIIVAMMWAGSFIAGRILSQDDIPPLLSAFLRFALASILLVSIVFITEKRWVWINRSALLITALMGLSGIFAYNLFFFSALGYLEAGRTALFASLSPILTVLFACIFFKEKLSKINYFGIILAFIGAFVVVSKGDIMVLQSYQLGKGELLMCGAVFTWVMYTLFSRVNKNVSPLLTVTYVSLWGTLFFLILAIGQGLFSQPVNLAFKHYASIFYLGAIATVWSFIWYAQGIHQLGASKAVVFTNLVPIFAVIFGMILLDEPLLWSMIVGAILIFVGVYLTNKKNNLPEK